MKPNDMTQTLKFDEEDGFCDERNYLAYTDTMNVPQKALTHQQVKLLADIQVPVAVQIDNLSLSADTLVDMFVGQTIDFDFDPNEIVELVVGVERVATAKFAVQDGRLALEIISVGEKIPKKVETEAEDLSNTSMRAEPFINEDYFKLCEDIDHELIKN